MFIFYVCSNVILLMGHTALWAFSPVIHFTFCLHNGLLLHTYYFECRTFYTVLRLLLLRYRPKIESFWYTSYYSVPSNVPKLIHYGLFYIQIYHSHITDCSWPPDNRCMKPCAQLHWFGVSSSCLETERRYL